MKQALLVGVLYLMAALPLAAQQLDIFEAISNGNIEAVRALLDAGADPNLGRATASSGALLVVGGTGIQSVDVHGGATPLILAAEGSRLDLAQLLLERGARVDGRDLDGRTPLMGAARAGAEGIVSLLLEKGAGINATSHSDSVDQALERGVDGQSYVTKLLTFNALDQAVQGNRPAIVALLLKRGARVNAVEPSSGWTSLMTAATLGRIEILLQFIAAGADPTVTDKRGRSPLSIARENGSATGLLFFMPAKMVMLGGVTPLHLAAQDGNWGAAQKLLERGADPNARTEAGNTPLALLDQERKKPERRYLRDLYSRTERILKEAGGRK
jgi:ankyrin repeat protein